MCRIVYTCVFRGGGVFQLDRGQEDRKSSRFKEVGETGSQEVKKIIGFKEVRKIGSKVVKLLTETSLPSSHHALQSSKLAFTLAEVLITLGIIGVVAAMTLPSLIANYQDKVVVAKVKKAYSIFSQAYVRAIEANGGLPKEDWDCSDFQATSDGSKSARCYMSYMLPYIKTINVCKVHNNSDNCKFSSFFRNGLKSLEYYSINGEYIGYLSDGGGGYGVAADGFEFMIYRYFIAIKTDKKDKNILNKNLFFFTMDPNKLSAFDGREASSIEHYLIGYSCPGCITSAVGWILQYDNLDYMRCPDKVSINGPHSCR